MAGGGFSKGRYLVRTQVICIVLGRWRDRVWNRRQDGDQACTLQSEEVEVENCKIKLFIKVYRTNLKER